MSDMLGSIIGTIFSSAQGSSAIPHTSNAQSEQTFSDMLAEADGKKQVGLSASTTVTSSATDQFMKYQKMTVAEKFRTSYLAEKGLSEEDLARMPTEDRVKIEEEIAARIRAKIAESTGTTVKAQEAA